MAPVMIDTTCDAGPSQACVDARQAEFEAIEADDDATVGDLNAAKMALADAQTALSDANTAAAEEMTVSGLIDGATTATADITDESTPAAVAAGRAAIDAAKESLEGMENLSDDATTALQGRIDALEAASRRMKWRCDDVGHRPRRRVRNVDGQRPTRRLSGRSRRRDAGLGGTGTALPPSQYRRRSVAPDAYNLAIKHGETSITVRKRRDRSSDDVEFIPQARDFGGGTHHARLARWTRLLTATWLKKS